MFVVGVGGTHANDGGQSAINEVSLVGMEPCRRAVARGTDVEGDGVGVLRLAFVAASHGSRHARIQTGGENVAVVVAGTGSDIAERDAEEVGTVFQSKLNALDEVGGFAFSIFAQNLDGHDFGSRGDTRLGASRALTRQNASGVCAVTLVVHGVKVLIENIIAVVGELAAAVPHAVGNVDVVVVDARVDEADDDAVARVARAAVVPNRRRVDFVHMPGVVSCGRANLLVLGNHRAHFVRDNHGNILTLGKLCNDFGIGRATEAVERPEGFQVADQVVIFVTFKKIKHLGLRGLTKCFSFGDDEIAALLFGHQRGFLRKLCTVVAVGHHNDDMLESIGLAEQGTKTEGKNQGKNGFLHGI